MTKSKLITGGLTVLIAAAAAAARPASLSAQRFGLSVGYTRMPGQLGAYRSNEGIAVRVGAELNPRSLFRIGLEGGVERLNQTQWHFQNTCLLPGGGTGTCYFDSRERDTGWSIAAILRVGPNSGTVRPYGLLGLGYLEVRTRGSSMVTDTNGGHLTNFEYNGVTSQGAIPLNLGGGLLFRPRGSPVGITVEGRASPILHSYSGGPALSWSPGISLGVRWGG